MWDKRFEQAEKNRVTAVSWLEILMPNEYVSSIYEIDLERLWERGIRLILTDLDNTLVPWNEPTVPESLTKWLKQAHDRGFHVCIVSNNTSGRVEEFAQLSGLPAVGAAKKPKPIGFQQALNRFQMGAKQAVMVGDQLFTDIRGGNRLGMYTVLVLPIEPNEWWGTRMVRNLERVTMPLLRARGLQRPNSLRR
ncbi:YqeG family HAD IIIA-type phosphatase [Alicyclobacillus fastidiosus]|uniref:YqeG family HAD IIIA-type phosphatase n=1 Tax=Alicyclobacillus fastidiosus TaxID=392011 RepID=A0ABV5ACK6_9BACL|nr:YqeG family HAD IIIA-type phosphatase [Alicyclobacillus fastidiosus]WEH11312.1 YqeG family HAD IIIA-type phosphatase [Alicyclobacillus fastidiosus]